MNYFSLIELPNHYSHSEKLWLAKVFEQEILLVAEEDRISIAEKWLEELKTGKPYQYIIGKSEFYNLSLEVNPHVLIPRPETEEMVSIILKQDFKPKAILDIGTGSGCIAIALKKKLNKSTLTAMDISAEALATAKRNALQNNVAIHFIQDDIMKPIAIYGYYDLMVSNPPYIGADEILDKTVVDFEPKVALYAPTDVLKYYKAIADFALTHLKPEGEIFVEINQKYGNKTKRIFENRGFETKLLQDMSGNDRFIQAFGIELEVEK